MARSLDKIKARKLRRRGQSIKDIAKQISASPSIVSKWCNDILLTEEQQGKLWKKQLDAGYRGRMKATELKKRKRLEEIERLRKEGIKEVGKLNKREFFTAGIGLYWGEGFKSYDQVAFVSSDPQLVLFMIDWLREFCGITDDRFALRVGLNEAHKKRIKVVEKYWSKLTGIPLSQFTKTSIKKVKTKKIYENFNDYYGALRIVVRRGTRLHRKIIGWIEGLNLNIRHKAGSRLVSKVVS